MSVTPDPPDPAAFWALIVCISLVAATSGFIIGCVVFLS